MSHSPNRQVDIGRPVLSGGTGTVLGRSHPPRGPLLWSTPVALTEPIHDGVRCRGHRGLINVELHEQDHPIAGQIMGSHLADFTRAATNLVKLGFDVIDIHLACPMKRIRRHSRGGYLLVACTLAIAILEAVRQAVDDDRPCTVKLRRGLDDIPESFTNFCPIFEPGIELGFRAAIVQTRTVSQKNADTSRWSSLRHTVEQCGKIDGFGIVGSGVSGMPIKSSAWSTKLAFKPRASLGLTLEILRFSPKREQ